MHRYIASDSRERHTPPTMPDFLDQFNALKAAFTERAGSPHRQWHQDHNSRHRDHGTSYSRPPPATPYWTAVFSPDVPISQEWRYETGAHGWGNNELEDYTTSPENSFIRPSTPGTHALVIRAAVRGAAVTSARLTSRATLGRDRGYLCARITAPSASKHPAPAAPRRPCPPP